MILYTHTHTHTHTHTSSFRKQKGITLIALVITIIVLLILAGISIAMLTGENGILTKASTGKDETKKAEYKETLQLIGIGLRPEQVMEQLSSKEYMDRYEEKIQEEINKEDVLKGATKKRKDDNTIFVTTEEGWIYKVTENEVILLGDREEYPEPPDLEEAEIKFSYAPSGWTNGNVTVTITAKADKFSIQYAIKDPKDENSWQSYPETGVIMTENGAIYARLINELGETTTWATGNVSKIDRTKPNINVTTGTITQNSILVNVSASDTPSGLATSNAYRYYLNGTLIPAATGRSYNFTGLNVATQYTIKVIVYDQAGNYNEQTITPKTAEPTIADLKNGPIFSSTTGVKDSSGNVVKVPGGFKISSDSGNNVSEGVVIEDSSGNQFVWIPVTKSSDFSINSSYQAKLWFIDGQDLQFSRRLDVANAYPSGWYGKEKLVSIGGFYVSRFQLTKENGRWISKKGRYYPGGHRSQEQFINELKNNFINTKYAKTSLISGSAYDAMMRFVDGKRFNGSNYYNVKAKMPASAQYAKTGSSESDKVCNIYDLSGNGNCITAELYNDSGSYKVIYRKTYVKSNDEIPVCPSFSIIYYGVTPDHNYSGKNARGTLYVFE